MASHFGFLISMLEICAPEVGFKSDSEVQLNSMNVMITNADDDGFCALFVLFTKDCSSR